MSWDGGMNKGQKGKRRGGEDRRTRVDSQLSDSFTSHWGRLCENACLLVGSLGVRPALNLWLTGHSCQSKPTWLPEECCKQARVVPQSRSRAAAESAAGEEARKYTPTSSLRSWNPMPDPPGWRRCEQRLLFCHLTGLTLSGFTWALSFV